MKGGPRFGQGEHTAWALLLEGSALSGLTSRSGNQITDAGVVALAQALPGSQVTKLGLVVRVGTSISRFRSRTLTGGFGPDFGAFWGPVLHYKF